MQGLSNFLAWEHDREVVVVVDGASIGVALVVLLVQEVVSPLNSS